MGVSDPLCCELYNFLRSLEFQMRAYVAKVWRHNQCSGNLRSTGCYILSTGRRTDNGTLHNQSWMNYLESATMSQSAECGATVVPKWYARLRKHDTVWVVAARMRFYPWLETQWKLVADELYVTWRTIPKGLDISSSRLWRRGEGTSWIGPLSQPCTSPRREHVMS
jgi:hypothetical protein